MKRYFIFLLLFPFYTFAQQAETHLEAGKAFMLQNDYKNAITEFNHALLKKGYLAEAYFYRAIATQKLAQDAGIDDTEICKDLYNSNFLGYPLADSLLEKECFDIWYDLPTAHDIPQNVYCANFSKSKLKTLPLFTDSLPYLIRLNIAYNHFTKIDIDFRKQISLIELDASNNQIIELTSYIGDLKKLKTLNLSNNKIVIIAEQINQLSKLKNLYLHNNQLTKLPLAITQITSLEILDISFNPISEIPSEISNLKNLKKLIINGTLIEHKKRISALIPWCEVVVRGN